MSLSQKEINLRMTELRNLRVLHTNAKERIISLEHENKQLKAEIVLLKKENKELQHTVTDIQYQLKQLQTIIFKKKTHVRDILDDDELDKTSKPPRTKDSYKRPVPRDDEVTHTVYHPAPTDISSSRKRTKTFFVEDIPLDIKKSVTKHVVEQVWNGVSWIGAQKLPTIKVTLGTNIRMLVATLSVEQRLSYSQIQTLIHLLYKVHISSGEITQILNKETDILRLTYTTLHEHVQKESYYHMDETSWRTTGEKNFAWSMTGGESNTSIYRIGVSRGKGNAEKLKGTSTGVLVSDDYGAYKNLTQHHQLCFAHPLRKFRDLAEHEQFTDVEKEHCRQHYKRFKEFYNELQHIRVTPNPEMHRIYLEDSLKTISLQKKQDPLPLIRLKKTLLSNVPKYLTCLQFPFIPLTNNTAERSLRHLVIKRRISFGSTSHKGAHTLSVLMTVLKDLLKKHPDQYFERYAGVRV